MLQRIYKLCEFTDGTFGVEVTRACLFGLGPKKFLDLQDMTCLRKPEDRYFYACKGPVERAKEALQLRCSTIVRYLEETK